MEGAWARISRSEVPYVTATATLGETDLVRYDQDHSQNASRPMADSIAANFEFGDEYEFGAAFAVARTGPRLDVTEGTTPTEITVLPENGGV